jgi:citron Rho-interacting kinase
LKEVQRLKVSASDFEVKNVIGRGHFGEVQVVRDRHTETVYAMKTLRKQETLAQSEVIKSLSYQIFTIVLLTC